MDISILKLKNGIEAYVYQSPLYTQTSLNFNFYSCSAEDNAAKSLMAMMLMEGSRDFPTSQAISLAAAREFGASIHCGSSAEGGLFSSEYNIGMLTKESLTQGQKTFENMADLLAKVIQSPLFLDEHFSRKREELLVCIKRGKLDKDFFAYKRFFEIALGKNSHTAPAYGDEEDALKLSKDNILEAYTRMMLEFPRKIFIGTNLSPEYIRDVLDSRFGNLAQVSANPFFAGVPEKNANTRLEEKSDFDQSMVYVGFPFSVPDSEKERQALALLSFYVGGYSGGRLFTEIRTKRDMAYGAYSGMDFETGIIYGHAGIDIKNKDATIEIMIDELKKAAEGKFTKSGIEKARKYVLSQIEMEIHAKGPRLSFLERNILGNRLDAIKGYENRYKDISYDDVAEAASRIQTAPIVYCLQQGGKK